MAVSICLSQVASCSALIARVGEAEENLLSAHKNPPALHSLEVISRDLKAGKITEKMWLVTARVD